MATASRKVKLLVCLSVFFLLLLSAGVDGRTIQDVLQDHGLPVGLFPNEVESYTLDQTTGLLEVHLGRPCYAHFDGLTKFEPVVRGNLSYGELRGIEGLSQEELFFWLPVKGVMVSDPSSGLIIFDIFYAHKQLSLWIFNEPHECRPVAMSVRPSFQDYIFHFIF